MLREQNSWIPKINDLAFELSCLAETEPLIGSSKLQALLGVGPRESQRILAPIVVKHNGKAGLARIEAVIERLKELAGADPQQEQDRQRRFARWLVTEEQKLKVMPRLLVDPGPEVVRNVLRRGFDGLPDGITLEPGKVTIQFSTSVESLEKLGALALAIARRGGLDQYEEKVRL